MGFGAVEMPYLCPQRNKSGEVLIVFYGTHNTIGNLSSTVEYQSWEMLGYSQNYSGRRYFWKENLYFDLMSNMANTSTMKIRLLLIVVCPRDSPTSEWKLHHTTLTF